MQFLFFNLFIATALGKLLVSFNAADGDDPSVIGQLNLEAARGVTQSGNTDDLYIELGEDPNGTPAAHFHRIEGDIRAEYHALNKATVADTTYYIGYAFSLAQIEQSLMVWQLYVRQSSSVMVPILPILTLTQFHSKEYVANNDGGANIPLALEVSGGKLDFQYQSSGSTGRVAQWNTAVNANEKYHVGIVINTSTPGWVQLYWGGKLQTFNSKTTNLTATTFPGRADPKFGAYRGEAVGIDTYVYEIQIGTKLSDIASAAGIGS
jgi:hypothetical protein